MRSAYGVVAVLAAAASVLFAPASALADRAAPPASAAQKARGAKPKKKSHKRPSRSRVAPIAAPEPPLTVTPAPEPELATPETDASPDTPLDAPSAPTEAPDTAAPAEPEPAPPPPTPPPLGADPTIEPRKLELGGRIFSYVRVPIAGIDEPLQQLSTSVWLDAKARMSEATFATVSVVGDLLTPSAQGKIEARARLREAYAGVHKDGIEVRIGHQITSWGNADGIHAVDLLTAHDYAFFSVSGDTRQIGAPSVLAAYSPKDGASPLRATVVWQPVFPASRVLVPRGVLPPNVRLLEEDRPEFSIAQSEIGVKLGWSPGGWDVALIGFEGFNHLAQPYLKSIDGDVAEIGRAFHRYHAVGLQSSVAAGPWVLRLEGAYVATDNRGGRDPRLQPSHVHAIAGVDRSFGERVRASVQGVFRYHPAYGGPGALDGDGSVGLIERNIAHVNAILLNYTHPVRPGATAMVAYTSENETLEISVAGMAYFVGFDWVVQPMIGYRLFDSLKLDAGVQVFGGKKNSLGALSSQNGIFAQATYAF